MTNETTPVLSGVLLDESTTVTLDELGRLCRVQREQIVLLVDEGVLEPLGQQQTEWRFTTENLHRARIAIRLQHDLGVNLAGVALVLDLMTENDALRARLRLLQAESDEK
jgi:chaperone modulatory protein CbpM